MKPFNQSKFNRIVERKRRVHLSALTSVRDPIRYYALARIYSKLVEQARKELNKQYN